MEFTAKQVSEGLKASPAGTASCIDVDWFPDWRGKCCAIIASGPSTKSANVSLLQGRLPVMAIKENVTIAPWADVVYGCDAAWWKHRKGLAGFKGLKISYAPTRFADIRRIEVRKFEDKILVDEPGVVGSGGNSGFQGLNLAVQFGARRILLIGFDMHDRSGVHWYGRNAGMGMNNPGEDNFKRWRAAFAASADWLRENRIEVVNASPISALTCFRKTTIERALAEWL